MKNTVYNVQYKGNGVLELTTLGRLSLYPIILNLKLKRGNDVLLSASTMT